MKYDLEERTLSFARGINMFIKKLSKTTANVEYFAQLLRSSGSVGANYIEANEAISKKDFILRIKIAKKEAKESYFWLNLLDVENHYEQDRDLLMKESLELTKILGAILIKSLK